jgi:hypothetical protein
MAGLEHETLKGGAIQKELPYYESIIKNYNNILINAASAFQNHLPDSLIKSLSLS